MKDHQKIPSKKKPSQPNEYLKYTGLAFQLFGVIAVFTYIGYLIDEKLMGGKTIFLIVFMLLGTFGSLYQLYRSLPK
ncbi:AtpZ/AtpI family protein [Roseivirga sp. BDSF3-8]|uniref:AtpZ/AtpI family protein n=1 Tax=Roseivirga sp. BDSF3-8 TaxID=3241598 RepID=UPI0035327169